MLVAVREGQACRLKSKAKVCCHHSKSCHAFCNYAEVQDRNVTRNQQALSSLLKLAQRVGDELSNTCKKVHLHFQSNVSSIK